MPPGPRKSPDVVLDGRSRQQTETPQGCQHRKAEGLAAGEQMLGIGKLDPVDPGRRLSTSTR